MLILQERILLIIYCIVQWRQVLLRSLQLSAVAVFAKNNTSVATSDQRTRTQIRQDVFVLF